MRHRLGRLLAAGLLLAVPPSGVDLSARDLGEHSLRPALLPAQEDLEKMVRRLVAQLGSEDPAAQEEAVRTLESLGAKALPSLERVAKEENDRIREWTVKIRARILATDEVLRRGRLQELILGLGSESLDVRTEAMKEILKLGGITVPFLQKALRETEDVEVKERLKELLRELDLPDPAAFYLVRTEAGRTALVARGGGSDETQKAVWAALQWLARHQKADGHWSAEEFGERCSGEACSGAGTRDYDVGLTGLALLAFLGAGYGLPPEDRVPDAPDPSRKPNYRELVRAGVRWLLGQEDREGCIGVRGMKYMYNQAIATAALAEAWGMTPARFLHEPAQRAVNFLLASQNPGKGWRYSVRCGDNDTSVTGWCVMALKSAEASSLRVPKQAYEWALAWLDEASEKDGYYRAGYTSRGTGKVYVPGKNESFDDHPALSSIAAFGRLLVDRKKTDPRLAALNIPISDLPEWRTNRIDYYYWYCSTLAFFQYDGPEGPMWKRWNEAVKKALVRHQHPESDGCRRGSWDPSQDRWGVAGGGRVYATAINALTLETYYRYPIVAR
jgi:hypothetical protein